MSQRIPVEILDNDRMKPQPVARVGRTARMQSQVSVNRIAAITQLTRNAAEGIASAYIVTAEVTERGIQRLERQDTVMARLGEQAAQDHQIAKENLGHRQRQLAEMAAAALGELFQRDLEDALSQPDSSFYEPTLLEHLGAWLVDGKSLELERRNLAQLTPGETVKEFFVGGVIAAKTAAYDQRQIAERRERLAIREQLANAHAHLAALAARNADLELMAGAGARDRDEPDDDEMTAQMDAVEDLLRQVRGAQQETESVLPR